MRAGIFLAALSLAFPEAAVSAVAIKINIVDYAGVGRQSLDLAMETASQIFAQADLGSVFCEAFPTRRNSGCPIDAFRMVILPRDMRERLNLPAREALGMALMTGDGHVGDTAYIFLDRIERLSDGEVVGKQAMTAKLLGHVMVHEIGHLLLGAGNHRLHSIMTPIWGPAEVQNVMQGVLQFCPEQAARIRESLRDRAIEAGS